MIVFLQELGGDYKALREEASIARTSASIYAGSPPVSGSNTDSRDRLRRCRC